MELKRIVGPDMRTALRMVRDQLGPDAIILSNRRTAAGVEIVAGPEEAWGGQAAAARPEAARGDGAVAAAAIAPRVAAAPESRQSSPMVTAVVGNEIRGLHSELRGLRDLLEQRFGEMHIDRLNWGPGNEGRAWRRLTRVGLPNELVHELVTHIDPRAPWEEAWTALRVRLASGLVEAGDVVAGGGVIAVVGPTGAGKTTTIAKLAVRHVLEHGAAGLALASLDATRIGGADALRALSRLLDVPFHAAREGEGVAKLVARAGDCQLLLLDTAGINRRAARHLAQIAELGELGDRVRTLLVLPANAQRAWVASALADYRAAAPVASVVTKLDETVSLGEVLGALHGARMPLAYVSDGQEIPDDLHVAQAAGLVAQALALDPEAEESPAPRATRPVVMEDNAARIA